MAILLAWNQTRVRVASSGVPRALCTPSRSSTCSASSTSATAERKRSPGRFSVSSHQVVQQLGLLQAPEHRGPPKASCTGGCRKSPRSRKSEADHIVAVNQPAHAGPLSGVPPDEDLPGLLPGEPLLPPRPGDLRPLASTAGPGLQAGQLRSRQGKLADLTFVRIREDRRAPTGTFMLETGLATWADFEWSLDATAHVSPHCLIMERAP